VDANYPRGLKHMPANAKVATVLEIDPSILQHSGIGGAADEAVLNKIIKKKKMLQEKPFGLK
jgi:hypothetical protein